MRLIRCALALVLVACGVRPAGTLVPLPQNEAAVERPDAARTAFTVAGRRIMLSVDGGRATPFFIKGVDYAPTPVCATSIQNPLGNENRALWQRDLPRLRGLGVNTIKIYNADVVNGKPLTAFLNAAYNGGTRPIYAILSIFFDKADPLNPSRVTELANQYRTLAQRYKASPGVMGISIGSEVNYAEYVGNAQWWAGMNKIARAARAGLGAAPKILTTSMIDDSMKTVRLGQDQGFPIDAWGINIYRGDSFAKNDLWVQVRAATTKPFIVGEWGTPASFHPGGKPFVAKEYPANKRGILNSWVRGLARDLYANSTLEGGPGSGGLYFEWNDEWWKAKSPCKQVASGIRSKVFPDGFNDEAWYGLFSIARGQPNVLTQRTTFGILRTVWSNQ